VTQTPPDNGPRPGGWAAAAPPQPGRPTGPALETPRLHLRLPDSRDTDAYVAFLGDKRSAMAGGIKNPSDAWRAFASVIGHWTLKGFGLFTAELKSTGKPVGLIGNLAYEAACAVHAHVFNTLKWPTAVSYIAHGNDRSITLAKRLGATEDTAARTPNGKPCHVFRHHNGALA